MDIINIHQAKTHLSRLVEKVAQGEPFIIAKAGKPVAKVVAIDAPEGSNKKRLGFLQGNFAIPVESSEIDTEQMQFLFLGEPK